MTDDALLALIEAAQLKRVARAGWVRAGVAEPESVAAHSWGVAWLAVVLTPPELDRERVLTYAVVHDLAEAWVGDLTPYDGVPAAEKARREHAAVEALSARLPGELLATWTAYEAQSDPEARFVRQLDRLDMAVQAASYARDGAAGMAAFVDSADRVISDPRLRAVLDAIRRR